ncbi:MAG: glycosyltransferase [Nanoarchaeota archaeon]
MDTVNIGLTRHDEKDELLISCLNSLIIQKNVIINIILYDQTYSQKIKQYCQINSKNSIKIFYKQIPPCRLSIVKNLLLNDVNEGFLLFTDPDCIADSNWAFELVKTLKKYNCTIVGGKILPIWKSNKLFINKSKFINEFYSLLDLGNQTCKINKLIGCNMGVNIDTIKSFELSFNEKVGRNKKKLVGSEDTLFCLNAINKKLNIFYTSNAKIFHQIDKERLTYKWIFKRAFYGGFSRGNYPKKKQINPFNKKLNFIDYISLSIIFIPYIIGYIYGVISQK